MKLTFSEVLELIGDDRHVERSHVRADALRRRVWVAEWHIPGCLSESHSVCLTKADAIACALDMADSPRGMRADLTRYGRSDRIGPNAYVGTAITTVTRVRLSDII